jgi:hypothetical protein
VVVTLFVVLAGRQMRIVVVAVGCGPSDGGSGEEVDGKEEGRDEEGVPSVHLKKSHCDPSLFCL